jgi:hypothetical protein
MKKILLFTIFVAISHFCLNQSGTNAYCTYHNYSADTPLTSCACSDGPHGLITRFHYNDLRHMFPYVAAWDRSGWNSPNCGACFEVTNKADRSKKIHITAIDQCGGGMGGGDTHLELAPPAFTELFGAVGIRDGHGYATWKVVSGNHCKGNLGSDESESESDIEELEFLQ